MPAKSPASMLRHEKRSGAFEALEKQETGKQTHVHDKSTQGHVQGVSDKLKTKLIDYDERFKKTSVDLPASVLNAWSVHCALHGISKREHLFNLLVRDINKKRGA
jgi:hypothetical protein